MPVIKCICGLGNPGKEYAKTRHNVGFMALDALADRWGLFFVAGKGDFFYAKGELENYGTILLLKPTTYMNNSGIALLDFSQKESIRPCEFLVILDDFSLPFGSIRIRLSGSSGGHRGLESIILALGTEDIPRLRIGIGTLESSSDPVSFVLSPFTDKEMKEIPNILNLVCEAIEEILDNGFEQAMNKYNRTKKEVENA